MTASNKGCNFK